MRKQIVMTLSSMKRFVEYCEKSGTTAIIFEGEVKKGSVILDTLKSIKDKEKVRVDVDYYDINKDGSIMRIKE